MRSVLIGGGVAGCAVAAALRGTRLGAESIIIERRQAGSPAGMGFILMPNGLDALEAIAPEFDWRGAGRQIDRVVLRRADGSVLADHSIDAGVCVGRERFLTMLRAATGSTRFLEGTSISGLARRADGSTAAVLLEGGAAIEGDAFFGCDGAQSRTRGILFPEARLSEVVVKEIVSIADAPALARRLGNSFHKFHDPEGGLAIGVLAESNDRVVWFVQFDARRWPEVSADAASMAQFAFERIAGWSAEVKEAFAHTNFAKSHLWPTRDLPPLASLSHENVVLVGDAAHACLPFTSQGANGALVDAVILRELLSDAQGPDAIRSAFARYTELRRPHHRRMFMEGRRLREGFLAPMVDSGPSIPLVA
ncbi:MAG: hypothetical protein RIS45_1329 [Planctomycetota bacterium]